MRVDKLIIHGFKSFRKPVTIDFPADPGLYRISGENRVQPELGANGVGKSTVWDAVSWTLTGKTARGVAGGAVEPWGSKLCGVDVIVDIDGAKHEIRRARRPNRLTLDGRTVEQRDVEVMTGLNHERLLFSLLMGQFGEFFFDLKPTAKLNVFSDILDLQVWMDASKAASEALKAFDDEISSLETKAARLESRIATLEESRESVKEKADQLESDQKDADDRLRTELEDALESLATAEHEFREASSKCDVLMRTAKKIRKTSHDLTAEVSRTRDELSSLREEAAASRARLDDLEKRLHDLDSMKVCPWCGSRSVSKGVKTKLRGKIDAESETHDASSKSVVRMRRAVSGKTSQLKDLDAEFDQASARLDAARRNQTSARSRMQTWRDRVDRIQDAIRKLQSTDNTFLEEMKRLDSRIADARDEIKGVLDQLRHERTARDAVEQWPRGFKDVRLWIIETALIELEVAVNSHLEALGMTGWRVKFDVERETKAGGVSRGFSVMIHPPGHSSPVVPWESWSGGETQRLRIAGAAGLSDLICARTGLRLEMEVWDEPTAHLSDEGIEHLLDWLADRASSRAVWVIDHRSLDAPFDAEIRVVMTDRGSLIDPRKPAINAGFPASSKK